MLRVLGHVDRLAIILHLEDALGVGDANVLDWVGRALGAEPDHVVVRIHQQLIHQLVEPWIDCDGLGLEITLCIVKPDLVGCGLNAPDVGVGKVQDMLPVRVLTILVGKVHGYCGIPPSSGPL